MPVIDGRQDAPNLEGIRADHLNRYGFAADWLCRRFDRPFTVLDAACGVGYGSRLLAEAGGLVTGVDIAQAAIDKARRHFAHPAVRFACAISGPVRSGSSTRWSASRP